MRSQQTELLRQYQHLRQVTRELAGRLAKSMSKKSMEHGAKQLGLMRNGSIAFDSETEMAILMDFCIHDVRESGMNAVERMLKENPPTDSEERRILEQMAEARFSLFMIEQVEPGVGLQLRDLLAEKDLFIIDVNFSQTAEIGLVMTSRIVTIDTISMSTGTSLPLAVIPRSDRELFQRDHVTGWKRLADKCKTPAQYSEFVAGNLRVQVKEGVTSQVRYEDPPPVGKAPRSVPRPNRQAGLTTKAGRNDPCPCGSGQKYKHCCGGRRL